MLALAFSMEINQKISLDLKINKYNWTGKLEFRTCKAQSKNGGFAKKSKV